MTFNSQVQTLTRTVGVLIDRVDYLELLSNKYKEAIEVLQRELGDLRKYRDDNEQTLANYRKIADKFTLPPLKGGNLIGKP